MPRFKYWVIVMDGVATAFRASDAEELLPTLRQLQRRHPEASMKWFERDRYWDSPEAAHVRPPRPQQRTPSRFRSRDEGTRRPPFKGGDDRRPRRAGPGWREDPERSRGTRPAGKPAPDGSSRGATRKPGGSKFARPHRPFSPKGGPRGRGPGKPRRGD